MKKITTITLLMLFTAMVVLADDKLTGTPIGSTPSVDYTNGQPTTVRNTYADAFDGSLDTYFASYERSYTWVGLDLGSPHVITRVAWSPRNDGLGEGRIVLGVFEGANRADFMDALPLYIISERGTIGQMSHADIACSRGFRYVRYVGPSDSRCNIAEIAFYGHEGAGDDSHFFQLTQLPTVSIHTQDGVIPYDKETDIVSQVTIISDGGTTLLSEPAGVRERGNASRSFPKKPWRIKFDKKQQPLGAPAKAKKWTLLNNYGDKTLMRNLLAFELSKRMGMPYTPFGQPVDVLMNGEYKGCYQLCDQIEVGKGRINVIEMTPEDNSGSALTGGYLVEIDAYAQDEISWFVSEQGNPVTIKSPSDDEITSEQTTYITQQFNTMERNWRQYLYLPTFLRHFLVGELSGNTDTYWSTYMYKHRDDPLFYTGPVWDFDIAFDNDYRTYPINSNGDYIYRTTGSCAGNMRYFVNRIINDEAVQKQLLAVWDSVRQAGLTESMIDEYITQMATKLDQSQQLNFMRWPILNNFVHLNPMVWGSYEAEVDNVRRFMRERIEWMDNKLGYEYVPSAISTITSSTDNSQQVYSLQGVSYGSSLETLPEGVYIVKQGQTIKKIRKK